MKPMPQASWTVRTRPLLLTLTLTLTLSACSKNPSTDLSRPIEQRPSTAQANVSVLPQLLEIPGLARLRQVRLYLPPGYASSGKRYPVLYMHDGQNLFDDATAYAGEWKVDETLNALAQAGKLELIVVGIDNGQDKRMSELNPWDNPKFGKSEAKAYLDFIVKVIKPTIDRDYRSLPEPSNTAIMGSSMGGLISHYAITQYPGVFGRAGVFSPSYWIGQSAALVYFAQHPAAPDARLYLLSGDQEGRDMVDNMSTVYASLLKAGHPADQLSIKVTPGAGHNEAFWASEFEQAVLWLFKP
ncbi:alpha/beta hydrolase [Paucibacter sp. Y2R2-4]|uniref:alpha/beta hydrolase n=1 Tax=Paucibacter sp. Y2R2-4 TaxID=2893553 RepID=UPI0021E40C4F|nr:alpha/beta hydrolase-fold protein [Paucibacter sp. Y2R2-4]MCV2352060.1 alpha/beta hydrolase [Paucibacter sp. Y2R2-4]